MGNPKPICYCSQCQPGIERSTRTARTHLEGDRQRLEKSRDAHKQHQQHGQETETLLNLITFLNSCIKKTEDAINLVRTDKDDNDLGAYETVGGAHFSGDQHDDDIPDDDLSRIEPILTWNQTGGALALNIATEEGEDGELLPDIEIVGFDTESDSDEEQEPGSPIPEEDKDADTNGQGPDSPPTDLGSTFFDRPQCVLDIERDLLGDYVPPAEPPDTPFVQEPLSKPEMLSLKHYVAWRKSNGTVRAYNEHRAVLQDATGEEILSLYLVRKLARRIARLEPQVFDMCPKSCIAYTGAYSGLKRCPYVHQKSKKKCDTPRYKKTRSGKLVPRAQFKVLPVAASIQALYANKESSTLLRHRDRSLKAVMGLLEQAKEMATSLDDCKQYSDFADSSIHRLQYSEMDLFQDPRDIAFALSTDGAQLTMKKQSNTWIMILILMNLPPELRSQSRHVIVCFATPGPNSPGDIESFMRPLFEEFARLAAGVWIWDSLDAAYFFHRSYTVMVLGDMLGSAKMNGMSGHSAVRGDRFTEVEGARSSTQSGAKAQYYPSSPPSNATYNPARPPTYDLTNLPRRNQAEYWRTLTSIHNAGSKRALAVISKNTGVARIPLCVASPAFLHPSYFPLDPFHLFYENCMPFIWDTWATGSKPGERVHVPAAKISKLGELVGKAYKTLPPAFCGTIRDPALKRQSQYKAYEWMALLHWYILPIGLEVEFDFLLLDNFSYFVHAVETAMTVQSHSRETLAALQETINTFLQQYETLYVGTDPTKILRCRLCIFQLVHVPIHISWYGSIRNGSQATVEREIGHAEHQIHSKAHPFANLENILIEKETIRLLQLYIPGLSSSWGKERTFAAPLPYRDMKLIQSLRINQADIPGLETHFHAIRTLFGMQATRNLVAKHDLRRFGKLQMSKHTLRSRVSEVHAGRGLDAYNLLRDYRWFEIRTELTRNRPEIVEHQFAEAVAFYALSYLGQEKKVVVYRPLEQVHSPLRTVIRGKWPSGSEEEFFAMDVSCISNLIGIWEADKERSGNVYVLRKHPGLEMLELTQCGLPDTMEKDRDDNEE